MRKLREIAPIQETKRLAETPQLDTEIDRDWGYDSIQNAEIHYKQHKRKWRKVHDTPTHEIVARHLSNNGMFGDWDNSSAFAARNKKTGKIDIVTGGFYDSKNKRYQEHIVGARRGNKLKMPQLYSILLHTDTTREIQSDKTHSPGAKKSWKRLYAQNDDIQAGTLKGKRRKRLNLADFEKAYYGGKNMDKQINASRTRLTAKLKKKAKQ